MLLGLGRPPQDDVVTDSNIEMFTPLSRRVSSWVDGFVGGCGELVAQSVGYYYRACGRWPFYFVFDPHLVLQR